MAQRLQLTYDMIRSIRNLPIVDIGKIFVAVCDFVYENKEPDLPEKLAGFFMVLKPTLEDDKNRHLKFLESKSNNGKQGGRPKKDWENSQKAKKAKYPKKAAESDNEYEYNIYKDNIELNNIFNEYINMRKEIKKPIKTKRSFNMIVKELSKYDDPTKIKMIEKSIMNNWQGIFPLKNNEKIVDYTKIENFHNMMMQDKIPELKQTLGLDKYFEIKKLWKQSPLYLSF